jgi:surfactin synthase thioesterase subunit
MEELTSGIVDAMTPFLDKPYLIFGHSFGAIAGFEVIRKMRRVGLKQPFLFLAAGRRGAQVKKKKPPISSLPTEAFARELLKEYGDHIRPILESRTLREAFIPQILADFVLSENYHFCEEPPLDCPIVAYAGSLENDLGMDELMAWSAHTSQSFHSRRFPGDHFFIRESRELVIKAIGQRIAAIRFGETTRSYLRT